MVEDYRPPQKDLPTSITSISEFATHLGFERPDEVPVQTNDPYFIRKYDDYIADLYIQALYLDTDKSKRLIYLGITPLDEDGEALPSRYRQTLNLAIKFHDAVKRLLHEDEEIAFNIAELRSGGFDVLADLAEDFLQSEECEAIKEWLVFRHTADTWSLEEFKKRILNRFDQYSVPDREVDIELPEGGISSFEDAAKALGYEKIDIDEKYKDKWGLFTKSTSGLHVDIQIERLVHSPGYRVFVVPRNVHIGSAKRYVQQEDRFNIGRYLSEEMSDYILDASGRFNPDIPEGEVMTELVYKLKRLEEEGIFDTIVAQKDFYEKYSAQPLAFKRQIADELDI